MFQFKPDGSPNGYRIKIPEDYDSDSLDEEDALVLVEQNINNQWSGNFSDYNLIESSFKEMPNGRVDHSFLFEHNLQDIGEAKYRLRATVSGSIINSVSPFAFVPESFQREFANIRSDNEPLCDSLICCGAATAPSFLPFLCQGAAAARETWTKIRFKITSYPLHIYMPLSDGRVHF